MTRERRLRIADWMRWALDLGVWFGGVLDFASRWEGGLGGCS